jgi:hypothetical protein
MKDNIVGLETDQNKNLAMLEKLKRESDTLIEMYQQIAKIKYGAYKAFQDAGFTKEEALLMVKGDLI